MSDKKRPTSQEITNLSVIIGEDLLKDQGYSVQDVESLVRQLNYYLAVVKKMQKDLEGITRH